MTAQARLTPAPTGRRGPRAADGPEALRRDLARAVTRAAPLALVLALAAGCGLATAQSGGDCPLHPIYFEDNATSIAPTMRPSVRAAARCLATTDARIRVTAHVDDRYSPEYAIAYSQQLAKVVVAALVDGGVDPHRIESRGMGREEPVCGGPDEGCRRLNRRVDIELWR